MRVFHARAACVVVLSLASVSCQSAPQATESTAPQPSTKASAGEHAIAFGYKTIWLAVRTESPRAVVEALGGKSRPATWREGLAETTGLFVTPSIDGWVLVTGNLEAADTTDPSTALSLPKALSTGLATEVQYFGTHRLVEWHSWARVVRGEVVRAYGYVGESGKTLFVVGKATVDELALNFDFFDERSPDASNAGYWERTDLRYPGEEDVMRIAGRWSVDPTTLGERGALGRGWVVLPQIAGGTRRP